MKIFLRTWVKITSPRWSHRRDVQWVKNPNHFSADGLRVAPPGRQFPRRKRSPPTITSKTTTSDDRPVNAFGISGVKRRRYPGYDVDVDDGCALIRALDAPDEGDASVETKNRKRRKPFEGRQMGNELSKIRSMMKDKFGDKDDVAFKEDRKRRKSKRVPRASQDGRVVGDA